MNWQVWLSAACLIVWIPLSVVQLFSFIRHRHHEAIKCRFPLLTLYPAVFNHICAVMLLLKNLILSLSPSNYFPCFIVSFFTSGIIPLILIETNRTSLLIMKYNPEKRIGSKLSPFLKTRNQLTLLCFFALLNIVLFGLTLATSETARTIHTRRECYYMQEWHIYLILIFFVGTFPLMLRTRSELTLILDRWNAAAEANRSTGIMTAVGALPYIVLTSYFYFSDSQWRRYEFEDDYLSFELLFVLAPMIASFSQLAEPLSQVKAARKRVFDPTGFRRSLSVNAQPSTIHSELESQHSQVQSPRRKLSVILHDPDLLPLFDIHLRRSFALELLMFILESKKLLEKSMHFQLLLTAYESGTGSGHASAPSPPRHRHEKSIFHWKAHFQSPAEAASGTEMSVVPNESGSSSAQPNVPTGKSQSPRGAGGKFAFSSASNDHSDSKEAHLPTSLPLSKTPSGDSAFHFDFHHRTSNIQDLCVQCEKLALYLYQTYIQSNASLEINISGTLRQRFDELVKMLEKLRAEVPTHQSTAPQNGDSGSGSASADPLIRYWHRVLELVNLFSVAYEEVAHLIEINLMRSFLETDEFQQYYLANERQNAFRLAAALGLTEFIDPVAAAAAAPASVPPISEHANGSSILSQNPSPNSLPSSDCNSSPSP